MLPLEVVVPGGSLSMLLYYAPVARCQTVLAGGRGDGGTQVANGTTAALVLLLGVCLLAAAAAVAAGGLCMALDFKIL